MKWSRTRALVLALLAAAFVGYALLLWQGPWWLDGDRLRRRDLQPADGVVITGFRTTLVALGAGAVAGQVFSTPTARCGTLVTGTASRPRSHGTAR
ncbi:hypothetical protein [Streptomyces sp. RKAG290]|uniref:hypothetical protein n=1 Tax=Streptomyces sp. RKAG290 TaxID=2888348 RepID=UPI0020335828|nr:hypothetical protein [Streptomyces sp. RKAG290]MCM2416359.1 hypothetical protein [Streptomyces sp. RKAG290]